MFTDCATAQQHNSKRSEAGDPATCTPRMTMIIGLPSRWSSPMQIRRLRHEKIRFQTQENNNGFWRFLLTPFPDLMTHGNLQKCASWSNERGSGRDSYLTQFVKGQSPTSRTGVKYSPLFSRPKSIKISGQWQYLERKKPLPTKQTRNSRGSGDLKVICGSENLYFEVFNPSKWIILGLLSSTTLTRCRNTFAVFVKKLRGKKDLLLYRLQS